MVMGYLIALVNSSDFTKGRIYNIIGIEDLTFYATRYYYYFNDHSELSWAYRDTPYFEVHLY